MLVDSYILPECIARPGSFGGLMALYEANFMKLCQLVECLEVRAAHDACGAGWPEISVVAEDCTVYFAIQNRSKYTCEVRLTYLFDEFDGIVSDPDLVARVYFDARMVEVTGWRQAHHHELLRLLSRRYQQELDLCWTRNMMLSKWLDYLLDRGHRFPATAPIFD